MALMNWEDLVMPPLANVDKTVAHFKQTLQEGKCINNMLELKQWILKLSTTKPCRSQ
jgi:hypothetical protein